MRSLIFSVLFLFSGFTWAGVECVTSDFPTTSYLLIKNDKGQYQLDAFHHNGAKYAPIHNGIITSSDFKHLKKKSDLVLSMGDNFRVIFDANECSFKPDHIVCHTNTNLKVGEREYTSFGFSTYKQQVVNPYGDFTSWNTTTYARGTKDPFVYRFEMEYAEKDCVVK